jgi:hypothetical protein
MAACIAQSLPISDWNGNNCNNNMDFNNFVLLLANQALQFKIAINDILKIRFLK